MANNYSGTIKLSSGLTTMGTSDYPLVEAHAVLVDKYNQRLDDFLDNIQTTTPKFWEDTLLSGSTQYNNMKEYAKSAALGERLTYIKNGKLYKYTVINNKGDIAMDARFEFANTGILDIYLTNPFDE